MKTLLVAIDHPLHRDLIRMALRMFPGTVGIPLSRGDLQTALEGGERVDGVIIEYRRDRMGGDQTIREVHRMFPEVPLIALAPETERQQLTRAKAAGEVATVLPLPIDAFDLLGRLDRFLNPKNHL